MQTTKPNISGMDAVAYLIKDVERACRFYGETLGLPLLHAFPGGAEYELADGTTLSLYKMEDGSWERGGGIMFHVDDVPAAFDYYKQRGVKFTSEVIDTPACHMALGEDSEGNGFLLHARKA